MIVAAVLIFLGIVTVAIFGALGGIPALPSELGTVLNYVFGILSTGFGILNTFCYANVVVALWGFSLVLFNVEKAYKLVMWVLKKIPMFSVSD